MFYFLLQIACTFLFRITYRLRSYGSTHVPATGGVVLAANHASFFDPPIIACALPQRTVSFMAKEELFRVPLFGTAIRWLYAIPVSRGGLTRAQLRQFTTLVGSRETVLAVFPEGTRSATGALGTAQRGVGAICRSAGVPVVPVLVTGTWRVWPRSRVFPRLWGRIEVRFGPPVQWSHEELDATGDASGALATLIMKRIAELHNSEDAPTGFWEGFRLLLKRGFTAGQRANVQPASQGGVEYRGKSH